MRELISTRIDGFCGLLFADVALAVTIVWNGYSSRSDLPQYWCRCHRAGPRRQKAVDADEKLKRLYRPIKDGLTDLDEVLMGRLNALSADRDRAKAALERAKSQAALQIYIDPCPCRKPNTAGEQQRIG